MIEYDIFKLKYLKIEETQQAGTYVCLCYTPTAALRPGGIQMISYVMHGKYDLKCIAPNKFWNYCNCSRCPSWESFLYTQRPFFFTQNKNFI